MSILPMAYAGALGQTHLIPTLLPTTPPPTDSSPQVRTLLQYAASGGSPSFVCELLRLGYPATATTSRGKELPFFVACAHKHEAAATLLLAEMSPADLRSTDCDGWSALHYASAADMPSLVRAVLSRMRDSNNNGDDDAVKDPITALCDTKGRCSLHIAAGYNAANALKVLVAELPKGVSPLHPTDSEGHTPLHTAARGGASTCIAALLDSKNNGNVVDAPAASGLTPLHLAALSGKHEACMTLLARGADPSKAVAVAGASCGDTAMHFAVASGSVRAVMVLVEAGADVGKADAAGRTPLHVAAATAATGPTAASRPAVMRLLVGNGADVNVRDKCGNTPLAVAVAHGSVRAISELISAGADPMIPNNADETPLHVAGRIGATVAVRVIMNHLWSAHSHKILTTNP